MRPLKIVVVVMGLLIVVGVGVVGVTIVNRLRGMAETAPAGFGEVAVTVPAGARVADMTTDGDRLLLRLERGDEAWIVVVDLATGAELGRFSLTPAP